MFNPDPNPSWELKRFAKLEQTHVLYVDRVLRRMKVDHDEAQDLRQAILLSAHRSLASFQHRSAPETWLHQICVRAVTRYRRHSTRLRALTISIDEFSDLSHAGSIEQAEHALESVLHELDEREQQLIRLHFWSGLSVVQSAHAVGCTKQVAYQCLYKFQKLALNHLGVR